MPHLARFGGHQMPAHKLTDDASEFPQFRRILSPRPLPNRRFVRPVLHAQQLAQSLVAAQALRVAQTRPAAAKAKAPLRHNSLGRKPPALVLAPIQQWAASKPIPEHGLLGQRADQEPPQ